MDDDIPNNENCRANESQDDGVNGKVKGTIVMMTEGRGCWIPLF